MFIFRKNGHFYEKIGKKGEPVCIDDEIPFVIPETWEYCRLNSIGNIVGGGTPKTKINEYWENGDIPWLTPADMKYVEGKYVSQGARNITNLGLEKSSAQLIPKNSIVYSSRAPIGYIAISNNKLSTNQGFKSLVLIDFNIVDYMYYCLISFTDEIKSRASGTTFKEISKTKFGETIIPIPPINEQKRIVKKIEELIPLITEYGNLRKKLDKLNSEFPDKIKSSILQEAIRGKLVPQDPNNEPASILLERIHDEKERLIKEKKIKRNKNESFIYKNNNHFYEKIGNNKPICIDNEISFEIPNNWAWVRLDTICKYIQRGKSPKYSEIKKYPVVAQKCNQWSGFSLEKAKFIDPKTVDSYKEERILQNKDIMWNSTGLGTLGRVGLYDESVNKYGWAVADSHVTIIRPFDEYVFQEFIYLFLASPTVQLVIESKAGGSTKQKELNLSTIKNYLIPLAPHNEQKRIINKVFKLNQILG